MKTQALFICCLVVVSFATQLNPYMEKTKDVFAEISSTKFGQGMLSLIKVQTSVGQDVDNITKLLNDIKAHIESERDFDTENWQITKGILQGIIDDNQEIFDNNVKLIASQEAKLVADKAAKKTAEDNVVSEVAEVARLTKNIASQKELILTEQTAFDARQVRDCDAIEACNAALDLLRGFCDDDEESSAASFIQINQLADVTEQFKQLGKADVKYLPLINALTQLAASGSYATVDEVIVLITELRDQIQAAYDLDFVTFPVNLKGWTATLTDLQAQLKTSQGRLAGYRAEVKSLGEAITLTEAAKVVSEGLRDDARETLDQKIPELKQGQIDFDARNALRAKQLAIIEKIKQIFAKDTTGATAFIQAF